MHWIIYWFSNYLELSCLGPYSKFFEFRSSLQNVCLLLTTKQVDSKWIFYCEAYILKSVTFNFVDYTFNKCFLPILTESIQIEKKVYFKIEHNLLSLTPATMKLDNSNFYGILNIYFVSILRFYEMYIFLQNQYQNFLALSVNKIFCFPGN